MMRRPRALIMAAACVALGSSLILEPALAADAASIDDSGWWWKLQAGPVPLPLPPNIAPGQLLVQGAPDGATAIAALSATLLEGESHPVLTLRVAEDGDAGGEGAVLLACQAGSPWTGGDARAWADKPSPACDAGVATGSRSEDGSAWSFDLTALQFGDQVNVVLVPGTVETQPEGANGSVFSLTFEQPSPGSIKTEEGVVPPPPLPAPAAGPAPPSGDISFDFSPPPPTDDSFALPPAAALPEVEQGLTPVAPSVQDRNAPLPASVYDDPRSPHAETVGVLLLLLGGGAIYLMTRQRVDAGAEGVTAGLGRWAQVRQGVPPALRS